MAANRHDWKCLPMPSSFSINAFDHTYTRDELERIKEGLVPQEMEDKWFIYFEEPWLFLHRSWTGHCIYQVRFEIDPDKARAVEIQINEDASQFNSSDKNYNLRLASFLIDNMLLGKNSPFPLPPGVTPATGGGIFQHHVSGTGYREST